MVFLREPSLFPLGCAALLLGWSYHGPPLQLAYRGLGELDVVVIYGPAIALAAHILMGGQHAGAVVWASLPLGVFIAAFLWVNEFPDHDADRGAGKRNLVVRLGKHRASRLLPLLYTGGILALAVPVVTGILPAATGLAGIALLPAGLAARWCWLPARAARGAAGLRAALRRYQCRPADRLSLSSARTCRLHA